jgi:hypothetical protein
MRVGPAMKDDLATVLEELRREQFDLYFAPPKLPDEDEDDEVKEARWLERMERRQRGEEDQLTKQIYFMKRVIEERGEDVSFKEVWREKWDGVDRILPELVSLAKIQPDAYRDFCLAVHERLLRVQDLRAARSRFCDEAMLEAERRLRHAQDAVLKLSERQQDEIASGAKMVFEPPWTHLIPAVLAGMAKFTGSGPYEPSEPSKRGPKKKRSNVPFRDLVRDLWRIAQDHRGDFSLWPDDGYGPARGTLVDALRLLEPVLPPDFVPEVIPRTTLESLRPDRNFGK